MEPGSYAPGNRSRVLGKERLALSLIDPLRESKTILERAYCRKDHFGEATLTRNQNKLSEAIVSRRVFGIQRCR